MNAILKVCRQLLISLFLAAFSVGYLLSPIDLIPDRLGALGFADDGGVIVYALVTITRLAAWVVLFWLVILPGVALALFWGIFDVQVGMIAAVVAFIFGAYKVQRGFKTLTNHMEDK